MAGVFPHADWVQSLVEKLNSDERYAQFARQWEGDLQFLIEPEGVLVDPVVIYLDLWHGKCRHGELAQGPTNWKPAFTFRAPYGNFVRVLKGDWRPMQAMLTRKLHVGVAWRI